MNPIISITKLKTYRKGNGVERLHTIPHHVPYPNGAHSANAALLAYELCKVNRVESPMIVLYMLMHDIAEGFTGDIPADTKRSDSRFADRLARIEYVWETDNLPDMPKLNPHEKAIAKCADILELFMYCQDELRMGNSHVEHVITNCLSYLNEYKDDISGVLDIINYYNREK